METLLITLGRRRQPRAEKATNTETKRRFCVSRGKKKVEKKRENSLRRHWNRKKLRNATPDFTSLRMEISLKEPGAEHFAGFDESRRR